MTRNGIGIGSAFLTLIFVTLCLAVFAMISHVSAGNEIALAIAEAEIVKGYYEADALAASIAEEIAMSDAIPKRLFGIDINTIFDADETTQKVEYSLPMSQTRELYVLISLDGDAYDILSWRVRDSYLWLPDTNMPVRSP